MSWSSAVQRSKSSPIVLMADLSPQILPWELFFDHVSIRSHCLLYVVRGLQEEEPIVTLSHYYENGERAITAAWKLDQFISFGACQRDLLDLENTEEARRQACIPRPPSIQSYGSDKSVFALVSNCIHNVVTPDIMASARALIKCVSRFLPEYRIPIVVFLGQALANVFKKKTGVEKRKMIHKRNQLKISLNSQEQLTGGARADNYLA
ncbi:hypothetical protein BWQ96_07566 [Gracilariopsis chorda]|uniref:Uncharacterized protein n=1 Tax=Gracilariopsis chorda TaxID=448386 RepID=A0A2V3IKZ4_9FLOR|nr:hypothetical protein BWQ96_07566 [Gracilariopsis chorda]|eukprot:PXF42751.1 hypothetical protein BWQ96_07566 [Gracilariopsis chorda]